MHQSGMFRFFDQIMVCCVFLPVHHQSLRFVADTQLCISAIRTKSPCGVKYVACHVHVALLLSFLGIIRGLGGVPMGALLVVLQQWLLIASVRRTGGAQHNRSSPDHGSRKSR